METLNPERLQRMRSVVERADRNIQPFRDQKYNALREYFGSQYGNRGSQYLTPVNLMHFATEVFTTSLAAGTPQALVTATSKQMQTPGYDLEIALNTLTRRIKLGEVVNEATFDAIYGVGIVRTGRTRNESYGMAGFSKTKGRPYAAIVSFDDFVFDVQATSWRDVSFLGNRYRVPLEDAKSNPAFKPAARAKLEATRKQHRQPTGEAKASDMSRVDEYDIDEIEDHVDLLDIYLCREKRMITIPAEGDPLLLRDVAYKGPNNGPYHVLLLDRPSEQLIPAAKAWQWMDLHALVNDLYRKAAEQAINAKTVHYGPASSSKDAQTITTSRDGDFIRLDSPQGLGTFSIPGADQATLLMAMQAKSLFNTLFGNPEVLAGVGAQSDTFGQDQLIASAANRMVSGMEDRVIEFAQSILESLAYYILTDSDINLKLEKQIPGTGMSVSFDYTKERAYGDLADYQITVEPYSLQRLTPQARLRAMNDVVMNVILPGAAMLESGGGSFDFEKYLKRYGRYAGISAELDDLVNFTQIEPPNRMGGGERAGMPATTTRREIRQGARGPGPSSDEAVQQALLTGMSNGGRGGVRQAG